MMIIVEVAVRVDGSDPPRAVRLAVAVQVTTKAAVFK